MIPSHNTLVVKLNVILMILKASHSNKSDLEFQICETLEV